MTPAGQVEGRELYEIIRETPRAKGTPDDLQRLVSDLIGRNAPVMRSVSILPTAAAATKRPRLSWCRMISSRVRMRHGCLPTVRSSRWWR